MTWQALNNSFHKLALQYSKFTLMDDSKHKLETVLYMQYYI